MLRPAVRSTKIALLTFTVLFPLLSAFGVEIAGLNGSVTALAFSPDGKFLAAADGGYDLSLRDTSTGALKTKFTGLATGTGRMSWSPDGKTIYGNTGNDWIAWDVATGKERLKIKAEMTRTAPSAIVLSADGKIVAAAGRGLIKFWNATTGVPLGEYEVHPNYAINSLGLSSDARFAVTTSNDRTAQLTVIAGGAAGRTFTCPSRVVAAEFSPDGKTLFVADQTPALHRFDVATGTDHAAPPMSRVAKQIAVSADGSLVACAASSLELWSQTENRWIVKPVENSSGAASVAFSRDGQFLACGDMEGRIHVWSVKDLLSKK